MSKDRSCKEWREELLRNRTTPEEMVDWARENVSEEYARELEEIIREFQNQEMKRIELRMDALILMTGFSFGIITRLLPDKWAGILLFMCAVMIIATMAKINYMWFVIRKID